MHSETYLVVLGILIVILSSLLSLREKPPVIKFKPKILYGDYPQFNGSTWTMDPNWIPR